MERFVRLILTGGIVLLAGLWILHFLSYISSIGIIGLAFTVLGSGALGAGIWDGLQTTK